MGKYAEPQGLPLAPSCAHSERGATGVPPQLLTEELEISAAAADVSMTCTARANWW